MTDHRAMAERALGAIDSSDDPRNLPAGLDGIGQALLAIHDTLTETRDRLPEPEGEPMCGYSKCPTEPIPVPRPEAEGVPVGEHHPLANLCQRHYCEHEHDPLPADEVHFVKPREDEEPDVALAKVIHETERAHMEAEMGVEVASWESASEFTRTVGLIAARAVREHIAAEGSSSLAFDLWAAREKAEEELADMTRQREELKSALSQAMQERDEAQMERADVLIEREGLLNALADMIRQRDEATRERDNWRASSRENRHAAKRAES